MLTDKRGNISKDTEPARFNPLWSNTETTGPSIFAKEPVIVVERRHKDPDEIGRLAGLVIERATSADLEGDDLEDTIHPRPCLTTCLQAGASRGCATTPTSARPKRRSQYRPKARAKLKTTHYMDGDKEVMESDT